VSDDRHVIIDHQIEAFTDRRAGAVYDRGGPGAILLTRGEAELSRLAIRHDDTAVDDAQGTVRAGVLVFHNGFAAPIRLGLKGDIELAAEVAETDDWAAFEEQNIGIGDLVDGQTADARGDRVVHDLSGTVHNRINEVAGYPVNPTEVQFTHSADCHGEAHVTIGIVDTDLLELRLGWDTGAIGRFVYDAVAVIISSIVFFAPGLGRDFTVLAGIFTHGGADPTHAQKAGVAWGRLNFVQLAVTIVIPAITDFSGCRLSFADDDRIGTCRPPFETSGYQATRVTFGTAPGVVFVRATVAVIVPSVTAFGDSVFDPITLESTLPTDLIAGRAFTRLTGIAVATTIGIAFVGLPIAVIVYPVTALGSWVIFSNTGQSARPADFGAGITPTVFSRIAITPTLRVAFVQLTITVIVNPVALLCARITAVGAWRVLADLTLAPKGADSADAIIVGNAGISHVTRSAISAAIDVGLASVQRPVVTGSVRTQSSLGIAGAAGTIRADSTALTRITGTAIAPTVGVRFLSVDNGVVTTRGLAAHPSLTEIADTAFTVLVGIT